MNSEFDDVLRELDDAAATGLDLSPGDPLAGRAAKTIRTLLSSRAGGGVGDGPEEDEHRRFCAELDIESKNDEIGIEARRAVDVLLGLDILQMSVRRRTAAIVAGFARNQLSRAASPAPPTGEGPIDMVLFCPNCGLQHIDVADPLRLEMVEGVERWTNPPHKSHLCHNCGCIWRPADVPTNGVKAIATRGQADTFAADHAAIPTGQGQGVTVTDEMVEAGARRLHDIRRLNTRSAGRGLPSFDKELPEYQLALNNEVLAVLEAALSARREG